MRHTTQRLVPPTVFLGTGCDRKSYQLRSLPCLRHYGHKSEQNPELKVPLLSPGVLGLQASSRCLQLCGAASGLAGGTGSQHTWKRSPPLQDNSYPCSAQNSRLAQGVETMTRFLFSKGSTGGEAQQAVEPGRTPEAHSSGDNPFSSLLPQGILTPRPSPSASKGRQSPPRNGGAPGRDTGSQALSTYTLYT